MNKRGFKCLACILCLLMAIEPCFSVGPSNSDVDKNKKIILASVLPSIVGVPLLTIGG